MFHKFLSDPHMILTFPPKNFYFKKCTHHTHFWIDVNCVFWKNIDIYLYFDTIDGFGYRGIERRCGKIPHMTYLSHDKVGIWIDSHVGMKWFPPYHLHTVIFAHRGSITVTVYMYHTVILHFTSLYIENHRMEVTILLNVFDLTDATTNHWGIIKKINMLLSCHVKSILLSIHFKICCTVGTAAIVTVIVCGSVGLSMMSGTEGVVRACFSSRWSMIRSKTENRPTCLNNNLFPNYRWIFLSEPL